MSDKVVVLTVISSDTMMIHADCIIIVVTVTELTLYNNLIIPNLRPMSPAHSVFQNEHPWAYLWLGCDASNSKIMTEKCIFLPGSMP